MGSKIQMSLIQANIKNMLLSVMAINYYVLMINLISLLSHTWVKMLFVILKKALLKKASAVVK